METNITQNSPVEFELDIRADREAIAERVDGQLKKLRPSLQINGFRPGKVPIGMVKKLHGRAVAYEVVDELIQEIYKAEVLDAPEHDVLGSPTVTSLEYEPDGDLHAQVQFGVRPKVELVDLKASKITRLAHEVTDDEIEQELKKLREQGATYESIDSPATEDDFVRVDLQQLDSESDTLVVGSRQEGVVFHLGADDLEKSVSDALVGKVQGDTARFATFHEGHDHDHRYEATVLDVQQRTLPELNDEFALTATGERVKTIDELRADIATQVRKQWDRALREKLEDDVVRRMVELHEFEIPPSVVELYLDSQIDDIARRSDGHLPEGFDIDTFKTQNQPEAERMARWMLIRDKVVSDHKIMVESDDLDTAFDEMGGGEEGSQESIRAVVEKNYPAMVEQMERRIENQKVFDALLDQFQLEDGDWTDDRGPE
jgi:trigger factor